ncbi:MAG: hypothetical protein ACOX7W_02770 [Christensenellales bacterium]|jgi:hypothetical protein
MKPFNVLFWAVLLILAGLVMLINHFGRLNLKVGSIIFGLFIILLGISMLTGSLRTSEVPGRENMIFGSGTVSVDEDGDCNLVFSSATVDLRDRDRLPRRIEVNVVFSSARVLLPEGPVRVRATSAFGQVVLPEGGSVVFGDRSYSREGDDPIEVEINCVFGNTVVS